MRRLIERAESTPRQATPRYAHAAIQKTREAMDTAANAIDGLMTAARTLMNATEGGPAKREAFYFANQVDNVDGAYAELWGALEEIENKLGIEPPKN